MLAPTLAREQPQRMIIDVERGTVAVIPLRTLTTGEAADACMVSAALDRGLLVVV